MAEIATSDYNWYDPNDEIPYDAWDSWDATWLDRNYGGAPDECSRHWPEKYNSDGSCNLCKAEE